MPHLRVVANAPEGQRNSTTFWAANRLRDAIAEGELNRAIANYDQWSYAPLVFANRTAAGPESGGTTGDHGCVCRSLRFAVSIATPPQCGSDRARGTRRCAYRGPASPARCGATTCVF